jgi:hypothetical protein
MDCSTEAWHAGYSLSYVTAFGASTTGMFFPGSWVTVKSEDWIQLECGFVLIFRCLRLSVSCYAEAGSSCSRKLYYLDVTFMNINKTFPFKKTTKQNYVH